MWKQSPWPWITPWWSVACSTDCPRTRDSRNVTGPQAHPLQPPGEVSTKVAGAGCRSPTATDVTRGNKRGMWLQYLQLTLAEENKTKQNPTLPWAGKLSAHREAEPVCSHPAGHWEEGTRPVTNSFHGVSRLKSQPGMKPHTSRCV